MQFPEGEELGCHSIHGMVVRGGGLKNKSHE